MRARGSWIAGLLLLCGAAGCKSADERAAGVLKEAEAALGRQQWDAAFAKAREAAQLSGISEATRDQARLKEEQARAELQASTQYARFAGAVDGDIDTAVAAYRDLPAASYYRGLGKEAYERIRPAYIADHLGKAQAALDNGRCGDVKPQAQLVLDVDPSHEKALALSKAPCPAQK